ncbi:hypothetical protein PUN4_140026 [Paraburkholderia unamae]|nr:hypothetical protein PUN4_140026 [Paraburkholderia unamae]
MVALRSNHEMYHTGPPGRPSGEAGMAVRRVMHMTYCTAACAMPDASAGLGAQRQKRRKGR